LIIVEHLEGQGKYSRKKLNSHSSAKSVKPDDDDDGDNVSCALLEDKCRILQTALHYHHTKKLHTVNITINHMVGWCGGRIDDVSPLI